MRIDKQKIHMCTRQECFERLHNAAPYIRKEYGVTSMCVFGSMARGDNREDSDVDVFVEMPPKFFLSIRLKHYLEDLLGKAVDLIGKHGNMDAFFLNEIKRDGIVII